MLDTFQVVLKPHTVEQKYKNVTFTKSLNDELVFLVTCDSERLAGYCYRNQFLPLSGKLATIAPEIQRQINTLKGYSDGNGPSPVPMNGIGRTAEEQRADGNDDDYDEEVYE